jgi:prephenate dehydratase
VNKIIAIQGEAGSFHHSAAIKWYGKDIAIAPCTTFKDVFIALDEQIATSAIVAIENSIHGSINEVYDLLISHKYYIVGEIAIPIEQCLITLPGAKLTDITHIHSHPVALSQCSNYLDEHLPTAERVEDYDTAASVSYIKQQGNLNLAAIASSTAAKMHKMPILARAIQNHDTNMTRFLVLDKKPADFETDKLSMVIQTSHTPGALYKALGVFDRSKANLTKLQSRPIPGKVWRYMFYVDVLIDSKKIPNVTAELKKQDCQVRLLGAYNQA